MLDTVPEPVLSAEMLTLEHEAKVLLITDDATEKAALLVIAKCKQNERDLTATKERLTRPLLDDLENTRAPYIKAIGFVEAIRRELERRDGVYRTKKAMAQAEQQRLLIAESNRKQAEADEKVRRERIALAVALQTEDAVAIAKAENKVEKAEAKAVDVPLPPVVPTVAKRVQLETGETLTFKAGKPDWMIPGMDKTVPIYGEDLPDTVPRRFFRLDVVRVNNAVKAGETLPAPFVMTEKMGGTAIRKG